MKKSTMWAILVLAVPISIAIGVRYAEKKRIKEVMNKDS